MPIYEYHCDKCGSSVEDEHSIKESLREECPNCGAVDPVFHQDYSQTVPFVHTYDVKTFGQQSEANVKRWGKELTAIKNEEAANAYSGAAAGKSVAGGKPLGRKKVAPKKDLDITKIDVNRYIQTGVKVKK